MAGESPAGGGSFSTSFSDISSGLFGGGSETTGISSGTEDTTVTQTERLDIDKEGILAMINDALKGTSGLASIFGASADAGIFGGSGSKQGTEDLLAKIAGELAKVTGTKTATNVGEKKTAGTSTQTQESEGIVDQIGGFFGF